jgi:hypothetical protein
MFAYIIPQLPLVMTRTIENKRDAFRLQLEPSENERSFWFSFSSSTPGKNVIHPSRPGSQSPFCCGPQQIEQPQLFWDCSSDVENHLSSEQDSLWLPWWCTPVIPHLRGRGRKIHVSVRSAWVKQQDPVSKNRTTANVYKMYLHS